MRKNGRETTRERAESWEIAMPLLEAMYLEFKELGKKKPDGVVGESKIRITNRLLAKCREVLEVESVLQFLDLLEKDNMPQNSDVVLSLSQYVAAMKAFRNEYWRFNGLEHKWALQERKGR
jgi:hypothetical protein